MWPKRLLGHIYVQNQRVDLCVIQKKGAMQSCHNHDQDNFGVLFQDFFLVTLEAGFHIARSQSTVPLLTTHLG